MSTDVLFAALIAVAGGLAGGLVGVGGGVLFVVIDRSVYVVHVRHGSMLPLRPENE